MARAGAARGTARGTAATTALPTIPARAAAPAEALTLGVTAPVKARAAPAGGVPAVISAAKEELGVLEQRLGVAPIYRDDELALWLGLRAASDNRSAHERRAGRRA